MVAGVLAAFCCAALAATALGSFTPAKSYDVGMSPYDVAAGRLVGGHPMDLAVSSRTDGMVSLLKGKGNGKFGVAHPVPAGAMPLGLALGDFNRDHRTDIAVANQDTPGGVTVLIATKKGFRLPAPTYPAGDESSYVVTADFNGDGKLDLAVSNLASASISVLRGDGHGGFGPPHDITNLPDPFGMTAADLNGDGKKDIAVVVDNPYRVAVIRSRGNGTFRPPAFYTAGVGLNGVTAARLNGDSRPDLVATDYSGNKVIVLLGKRHGKFGAPHGFPGGQNPAIATALNYNHDGKTDIAVSNAVSAGSVSILRGKGNGRLKQPIDVGVEEQPYGIIRGHLDRGRSDDLATANSASDSTSVLLGR